jgi:hypothetical protein
MKGASNIRLRVSDRRTCRSSFLDRQAANRIKITVGGTMRYSMLVLSLTAALCAQTPPAIAPNPQSDKPPLTGDPGKPAVQPESGQSKPDPMGVMPAPGKGAHTPVPKWRLLPSEQSPKPPSPRWKLFPFWKPAWPTTSLPLLSDGDATHATFANPGFAPGNIVFLQQQGPCAIPLTNVLPPSVTTPTIRRVPIPDAQFPMKEVRPPAPSCDDRK